MLLRSHIFFRELSRLTTENERLLERIHELLVGAELREEAKESKLKFLVARQQFIEKFLPTPVIMNNITKI